MTETTILRVNASMNKEASVSRSLADALIQHLSKGSDITVITRDLADGVPFIDERWIGANFTDPAERTAEQKAVLTDSDSYVSELRQANVLVMAVPIYNFGVPAAMKAWIDQIARARETFQYTEKGPEGLLKLDAAYLIVTSGGTPVGTDSDYVTGYIKFLFGFLGVKNIEVIPCDGLMLEGDQKVEQALEQIAGY